MPIVGMTDTTPAPGTGMTVLGKLYKGAPKNAQGHAGRDLDHFRIEWSDEVKQLAEFSEIEQVWNDLYGDEPKQFRNVVLLGGTGVHEAFPTAMQSFRQNNTLRRQCDGEHISLEYNEETAYYDRVHLPCRQHDTTPCHCSPRGRLSMVFMDFVRATNILGYFVFSVGAVNEIKPIYDYLCFVQSTYGSLSGVSFVFGRATKKISVVMEDKKNQTKSRTRSPRSLAYLQVEAAYNREILNALEPAISTLSELPAHVGITVEHDENDLPASNTVTQADIFNTTVQLAYDATAHLFTTPEMQVLALEGLKLSGEIDETTDVDTLIAKLTQVATGYRWNDNAKTVTDFLKAASKHKLNHGDVLKALRVAAADPNIENISDFDGSKEDAWAAVVAAYCQYDRAKIEKVGGNPDTIAKALEYAAGQNTPF